MNNLKLKKSFTLVEVIIAVTLFAFFVGAAFSLFAVSQQGVTASRHRLQAANLAREGAELVRQIRDTAWLHEVEWGSLEQGRSVNKCWGLDENERKLRYGKFDDCNYDHWYLEGTTSDQPEIIPFAGVQFQRSISISNHNINSDILNAKKITITVSWLEKDEIKKITMITYLTDWKE